MHDIYLEIEGVSFVLNKESDRLFRLWDGKRFEVFNPERKFHVKINSRKISEEKAIHMSYGDAKKQSKERR